MAKLTKRQQQIYDYIRAYIQERGYPPTIREIGAAIGLSSPATVHTHVKALERAGLISSNPSAQRTITLSIPNTAPVSPVPRIGTVAAGEPILAFDDMSMYESVPLPAHLLHGAAEGEAFILDVKGDSMIEAGIRSGDMIVVHKGMAANNGDIVVARVNEETATVKRIFYEKDMIRLQPENSSMQPIYAAYDQVEVIGRVITLLRQY